MISISSMILMLFVFSFSNMLLSVAMVLMYILNNFRRK